MMAQPYQDEWLLDNPQLHRFITAVNELRHSIADPRQIVAEVRPHFVRLLNDQTWLPENYQEPAEESDMGRQTGMWLLYRAGDGGLAFSALVLPPGTQTPVHDHLAWGLVGLYIGEQQEDIYEPTQTADGSDHDHHQLRLIETQQLQEGTFYELIPPTGDIHRVTTTGSVPSISLHLLGNDTGCVWRHSFNTDTGDVVDFRSGYTNQSCQEETASS
jgi:predicted metal-dependent enzyme (double-stranded beta helix superfamily)